MSSGGSAGPLVPTFHGFVHNSMDGLILFEACLSGKLHHVPRRPHDRERSSLIKSGSIFIYEENASGIKRWTDGVAWSPSRILGNFLIYRELEKPFPPGEKKRAMKRKRSSLPGEPYPRRDSDDNNHTEISTPLTPPTPSNASETKPDGPGGEGDKDLERSLIGSLVDSYGFRSDGLVKKTMSISVNGISHHMVSYYKVDDVKNQLLPRPLSDPRLSNISVRPELYLKQNFRAPVEETEHYAIDGQTMHAHPGVVYQSMPNGYGVRPGQYFGGAQPYQMYGVATTTGAHVYGTPTGTAWPTQSASASPASYGAGYSNQYGSYYKNESGAAPAKSESAQPSGQQPSYGGAYQQQPYSSMPRTSTQSTSSMYQNQLPYGSRPAYDSPTTNGPAQHNMYGTSNTPSQQQQPYAVRSPTQALYGVQSGQQSQSPHPGSVKSPLSASHTGTPADGSGSQMQHAFRTTGYAPPAPQSGHAHNNGADMNGLGISGGSGPYAGAHSAPQYHQAQYAQ
ncbi:Global transcription regulator sge1 [Acrodontium crateriforme]|uniref:Global transcription regulator sge1 n=1 Tax=Acrodontium crateriforme TaxID=150365 RepID=A0AAQ3R5G8_9PEZI|nr:Global transcription regulator sge1 [Acrodontium crateriforme]